MYIGAIRHGVGHSGTFNSDVEGESVSLILVDIPLQALIREFANGFCKLVLYVIVTHRSLQRAFCHHVSGGDGSGWISAGSAELAQELGDVPLHA